MHDQCALLARGKVNLVKGRGMGLFWRLHSLRSFLVVDFRSVRRNDLRRVIFSGPWCSHDQRLRYVLLEQLEIVGMGIAIRTAEAFWHLDCLVWRWIAGF